MSGPAPRTIPAGRTDAIREATAIKVDALTMLGEFLKAVPKRGPQHTRGGGSKGSKREPLPDAPPPLADAGIDKKESSDAQALADLKEINPQMHEQVRRGWRRRGAELMC